MITLYGFTEIFPEGIGETKDLRIQWVLEETGLPYTFHGLRHSDGDLDTEAYGKLSPFHQVPVIDDDGFVLSESAAIAIYLAEKSGTLIPAELPARTRVMQWCFAAISTIHPTFQALDVVGIFDPENTKLKGDVEKLVRRFLTDLDRRLADRAWIASDAFTVADLLTACVLRDIRKTDYLKPFPKTQAYYERCIARPAWQKTLSLSAERLGVTVDRIR